MTANPTNMPADEFISYLNKHGITDYKQRGDEISFPCPFHGCDDDHRGKEEYHCGFNLSTCLYHCFKCDSDGNFITLQQHFGDYEQSKAKRKIPKKKESSLKNAVDKAFEATGKSEEVCNYFNSRGINNKSIETFKLGMWNYHGHKRLMIPVFDKYGEIAYLKLRKTPEDEEIEKAMKIEDSLPRYLVYPSNTELILVGEDQLRKSNSCDVLVCEGELDRIIAIQEGVKMPVVTAGGALTFKEEWVEALKDMRNIYLCLDTDDSGKKGFEKIAQFITEHIPNASIYEIKLPFKSDSHMDLTDYFVGKYGTADELFTKHSEYYGGANPIDVNKFKEMSLDDVAKILDLTIKGNYFNKIIIFLAMLLTYTEEEQLNVMLNARSSTGKTHLVKEVSRLFPKQDVLMYTKTSPKALYYNEKRMKKDEKTGDSYVDLERIILIFSEQQDSMVLENLRGLLSHDEKMSSFIMTNKGKNGKNVASEACLRGFASTFFCSANMRIDEQEQTRCFILSPESTKETIRASIDISLQKSCNRKAFSNMVNGNEDRKLLMDRILYIKNLNVDDIIIKDPKYLSDCFYAKVDVLSSELQRKCSHFASLVKGVALLNAPFRTVDGAIIATNDDIDAAMELWEFLSESMHYGLPPQILDFYKKYILSTYDVMNANRNKKKGITFNELAVEYYRQTKTYLNLDMVRKMYIPSLQRVSFISCDKDEDDKRQLLITPLVFFDDDLDKSEEK